METQNGTRQVPLGWGEQGDPIAVPETAVAWRLRRTSLKGGAAAVVMTPLGQPLLLPIETGPEDFYQAIGGEPGRYRLDACDAQSMLVEGVAPAFAVLTLPRPEPAAAPAPPPAPSVPDPQGRLLDTIDRLTKTNADALTKLAEQHGVLMKQQGELVTAVSTLVAAVDAAGVSRREPAPIMFAPPGSPAPPPATPAVPKPPARWEMVLDAVVPELAKNLPGLGIWLVSKFGAMGTPSAAPPPSPPPVPPPYSNGVHNGADAPEAPSPGGQP